MFASLRPVGLSRVRALVGLERREQLKRKKTSGRETQQSRGVVFCCPGRPIEVMLLLVTLCGHFLVFQNSIQVKKDALFVVQNRNRTVFKKKKLGYGVALPPSVFRAGRSGCLYLTFSH
jgi:hypothetical protein